MACQFRLIGSLGELLPCSYHQNSHVRVVAQPTLKIKAALSVEMQLYVTPVGSLFVWIESISGWRVVHVHVQSAKTALGCVGEGLSSFVCRRTKCSAFFLLL